MTANDEHRPAQETDPPARRTAPALPLLDAAWLLLLAAYVFGGASLAPFHGDESWLISMSRDFHFFVSGDFDRLRVRTAEPESLADGLRLVNGTVAPYAIGLGWWQAGHSPTELPDPWEWGEDWEWNVAHGRVPSEALLVASRRPAALLTVGAVGAVFALAFAWRGRAAAWLASGLLATHPVVLLHGRRAYMEAPLLAFGLATVAIAAAWAVRTPRSGRIDAGFAAALAVATGFAVASKHSAVAIAAGCYLALAGVALRREPSVRALAPLAASGLLSFAVFLALNPAWWDAPLARPSQVLELRTGMLTNQVELFRDSVYTTPVARIRGLVHQASSAPVAYFEHDAWRGWLSDSVTAYASSPLSGVRYGPGAASVAGVVLLALALVGGLRAVQEAARGDAAATVIAVWAFGVVAFILVAVPLAWQRYYMPLYPVLVVLAAGGAVSLLGRSREDAE